MKRKRSIVILLLISLSSAVLSGQQGRSDSLLVDYLNKYGQADITFGNPGRVLLDEISGNISVWFAVANYVKASVSPLDYDYMLDFPLKYEVIPRASTKAVTSAQSVAEAMSWNFYPTYQQYDTIMHLLASTYPALCRVDTIGYSIAGRLILSLVISDNIDLEEPEEPQVFFSSTMHGDELGGYVTLLHLAHHLLTEYGNGGISDMIIDSLQVHLNPLANPDGTYYGGDTISSPRRYNNNGRDLNRNFPDPTLPLMVQEPENVAMVNYMKDHRFVISGNIHSGAEVLNFPWDRPASWSDGQHADSLWFFDICRSYIDTLRQYAIPEYMSDYYGTSSFAGVVRGDDWYSITGSRQDYITYERQGREVTLEIDYFKETPASQLQDLWEYNYRSLLYYIAAACYGIHGQVLSSVDDSPLEARIYIAGHDRDSSVVFSESVSGYFTRLIRAGEWSLAISAPGYLTKYIDNITVEDFVQRYLVVRLDPDASVVPDLSADRIKIWPVPASEVLHMMLPEYMGSSVNIRILSLGGAIVAAYTNHPVSEMELTIEIPGLKPGFYSIEISQESKRKILYGRFIKY